MSSYSSVSSLEEHISLTHNVNRNYQYYSSPSSPHNNNHNNHNHTMILDDSDLPFRQKYSGSHEADRDDEYSVNNNNNNNSSSSRNMSHSTSPKSSSFLFGFFQKGTNADHNGDDVEGGGASAGNKKTTVMVEYKKSRPFQSFINIIKTFAGAGTFGLPWALKQSGLLAGFIGVLVMALLANYTMHLLVKCRRFIQAQEQYYDTSDYWKTRDLRQKIQVTDETEIEEMKRTAKPAKDEWEQEQRNKGLFYKKAKRTRPLHWRMKYEGVPDETEEAKKMLGEDQNDPNDYIYDQHRIFTYMDLGYEAMGSWGSAMVYFLLFMCNLGVCTVYLTMIAEMMNSMVPHIPHRVWLLFTIPIFVPMSWIRSYALMTPISILGTISLLTALISVLVYGFTERISFIKAPWHYPAQYSLFNAQYFTRFIGVVLFLFNTHTCVLPIEQSTAPRRKYGWALGLGFSFIVVINLSFALIVFLFFGTDIQPNALSNLPGGTVWVYIIKGCLVAEVAFTFAVVLMPVSEAFDEKVIYKLKDRYWPFILTGSAIRTLLVLFVVAVAEIFGDNFGIAMSFIGGLGPNLLGFGLPSLFYLILMRRHYGFITFMFNCFIIVFGLFALVYNTYSTYVDLRYPSS